MTINPRIQAIKELRGRTVFTLAESCKRLDAYVAAHPEQTYANAAEALSLANPRVVVPDELSQLRGAARALLDKIDSITTEDFARGAEKAEREALRALLEGEAGKG